MSLGFVWDLQDGQALRKNGNDHIALLQGGHIWQEACQTHSGFGTRVE